MKSSTLKIEIPWSSSSYKIHIGSGLLSEDGNWAQSGLGSDVRKVAVFSNPKVFDLYGKAVMSAIRASGLESVTFLMRDGERYKTLRTVEAALKSFSEAGLSRTDAVIALGGGVVGDAAGFAASVYLRGIRFLQIPTTLLAMIDSSVGGKTGVNGESGKNATGAFHQPSAVFIDTDTLATLPARQINAGFFEAVKHGILAGDQVMRDVVKALDSRAPGTISRMIRSSLQFKASIVAGDERESPENRSSKSRKVLNLGHTFAHALEKSAKYRRFLHGEAVGYGLIYAAELSKSLDLMPQGDVNLLYDVVHRVGKLPAIAGINPREVLEAFRFDKKVDAGSLKMVLLKGIGKPVIVDTDSIPPSSHAAAFRRLQTM